MFFIMLLHDANTNAFKMTFLQQYGWNRYSATYKGFLPNITTQAIGRVISIKGFKYHLITMNGELECELSGKLMYGTEPENLPKIGDWTEYLDYTDSGFIISVLPRTNALSRKAPGTRMERQVLATNIDSVCIIQGLDENFNLMRLERYFVQIGACGIRAMVVLNKSDLITDKSFYEEQVRKLNRNAPVIFCSTKTGAGIDQLAGALQDGQTYILTGSSGVGKSSLLNALMRTDMMKTGTVSDANHKGRHTTTTRDLFRLPNGALVIDSPGMREFGATQEDSSNPDSVFPFIDTLAQRCHYTDCMHLDEPGCAVTQGVLSGDISKEVYDSYIKLIKEQRRFQIKAEDRKRLGKQFGKMTREAKDHRKKYKF
jgi:ribosome biogenesis GTPase / thiamine phosphate phosphatase